MSYTVVNVGGEEMSINLNKEELMLSRYIARDKTTTWIEQEVLVSDIKPDVMKIIRVEAVPFIQESEVNDGTIKVSGRITYYILYRSMDGGALKGITAEYPFAQTINTSQAKEGMNLDIDVVARNVIYSLPNERKIMLKTELVFDYSVTDVATVSLPVNIENSEGIEYLVTNDMFSNVIAVKKESIELAEEIILPDEMTGIEEIVKVASEISNTDYKVSYNKILVKGDLNLRLMYIKSGETSTLGTYDLTVPFAGMIEFENISDLYKFDIKYTLQSLQLILSGGENNVINVQGSILARAIMYEEKDVAHISDFYSTNKELIYNSENVAVIKNKSSLEKDISINERIGTLDENSRIIEYQVDTAYLVTSVSGGNLYISGSIKVPVTYENTSTGAVDSKTFDVVVESTVPLGKEVEVSNVITTIDVIKKDITMSGGNVEANITLRVKVDIENIDKITVIQDIDEQDINESDFDSMYIYIVKKGDTLWSIAKKYKTTVAKIANVNNINDESKIDVGQKLLLIR